RQAIEMGQQFAGILARFDAHGGGVRLASEGFDRDGRFLTRFAIPEGQKFNHDPLPPGYVR
ncbi:hypothetical protein LTR94_038180, partial [Friedmanniomyces endolithicus]